VTIHARRLEQIEEATADLEAVFTDPDCFHSPGSRDPWSVQNYAISLASEFVGSYRDDEISGRLTKLAEAEDAGSPKDAMRHLTFVRRKVATRLREWYAEIATKPQVVQTHDFAGAAETATVADGATTNPITGSCLTGRGAQSCPLGLKRPTRKTHLPRRRGIRLRSLGARTIWALRVELGSLTWGGIRLAGPRGGLVVCRLRCSR
jgi:hypothetical protein